MVGLDHGDAGGERFEHEQTFGVGVVGGDAEDVDRPEETHFACHVGASVVAKTVPQPGTVDPFLEATQVVAVRFPEPAGDIEGRPLVTGLFREVDERVDEVMESFFGAEAGEVPDPKRLVGGI